MNSTGDGGLPQRDEGGALQRVKELVVEALISDRTPEEVCGDDPELLAAVRARWTRVRALSARIDAAFPSASAPPVESASAAIPPSAQCIPGYQIEALLGRGGMGIVYRARRIERGADSADSVALKVLHPHLLHDPGFRERFRREAEVGRRIVHKNVVRTLDVGTAREEGADTPFLVLEYVEGQTLRALLAEMGRVPEDLVRHVGREMANGLAAIHATGAVHRDVKPENVVITRDHVVKLMDLGVVKAIDATDDLSAAADFVGSLRYAAPEQLRRNAPTIDGRADLHALGVVLYELATGRHPFDADDVRAVVSSILDETPRRVGSLNEQLSSFLEEVIACLLDKRREARFADAEELAAVLDQGEGSAWWAGRSRAIRASTDRPPRRVRIPRETALFGRGGDVARLSELFSRARSGDGQVVLVEGEAGIGKSRLLDDFVELLRRSGEEFDLLVGGYPPVGAVGTNSAFAAAFREHFGDEGLEAALAAHLGPSTALAPAFASLLRDGTPPPGHAPLTQDAVLTAFIRTTQSLARRRPVLFVVEDLHFAPDDGRSLFAGLALATEGEKLLLVGTARPRFDETWAAGMAGLSHVSRLPLTRLTLDSLTTLLRDALGSVALADELAPLLFEKSDGNPYFVFELLRSLRESGRLVSNDGAWTTPTTIRDIRSPSSITDVIAARIAALRREEREVLEAASCYGFEFDPLLVGDVLGVPRLPFLRRLGALESAHGLVRSIGRSCVFDHHQIQEVVYAGLSQAHRECLHAAIAVALERRTGAADRDPMDIDGGLCASLAGHFFEGSEAGHAMRYLDAALRHLERGWKNEAVVRLIDRALSLPGALNDVQRCSLVLRRAERIDFVGRREESLRGFREAVSLADVAGDPALQARSRAVLGGRVSHTGAHDEAVGLLHASIEIWQRIGDRKGEAEALGLLASAFHFVARYDDDREYQRRRLVIAQEIGDARNESQALAALGNLQNLHLGMSEPDGAMVFYERSADAARRAGDPILEGRCAGNFANAYLVLGRFDEARTHYEESLERARESGDRASEARVSGNLGNVLWSLGLFADARTLYERCLRLLRETGYRLGETFAAANLGSLLTSLGRPVDALRLLEQADGVATDIGSRHARASVSTFSGSALAELGRSADAIAQFERALDDARAVGDRMLEADALVYLAEESARDGRNEDAARSLDEASAIAAQFGLRSMAVAAEAERALLPGGTPDALAALVERDGTRIDVTVRLRAQWVLWLTTRDTARLAEARRLLDFIEMHAPADCRASVVENVRLHREIRASSIA